MSKEPIYIDRPPRIQPELPIDEIAIPNPPERDEEGYARLIQVALPLLTIVGYVLIGVIGRTGRNPWFLIPMALSVVASTAFSIYSYRKEKQRQRKIEKGYLDRLIELSKEMHGYQDMQRRFYRYNYPDTQTTFRIVESAKEEVEKKDRTLRAETRLWERRSSDDDFGVIRLGMGTVPSTVVYVLGDVENFEDPLVRKAMKLEEDSQHVSDIPVVISLRQLPEEEGPQDSGESDDDEEEVQASRTPVAHAVGIAGDQRSVYEFVRAALAHHVVFHSAGDARLYILAQSKAEWAWTDFLPHSQGDDQSQFRCFVEEIETQEKQSRFDEDDEGVIGQFLEGIRKVLAQRKIRLQERDDNEGGQQDPTHPFLVMVVDLMDTIYDKSSPLSLSELESDAAISILLEEGMRLGAAILFLVPERSKVPSGCQAVIEIEKTTPATNTRMQQYYKRHFRYTEVGVNSFRYVGEADYLIEPTDMISLSQQLAQLRIRESFGANLTNAVPFLELMECDSLKMLEELSWESWQRSIEASNANWLRVKVGRMSGNKPRTLVFSAKRDGVHGMVAGSTGSGKSELLISMIVGMAVVYDPTVLNFVLVDYKGGGAFQPFEKLPHCVDIVTNLKGDGVTRMFTAIESEIKRRQALNVETNTKNIVDYRKKGLHQEYHPYPYLFIIIDEFAEMIADRAEFKTKLETITRVGRAQGVSLILAAQRPSGVTDQMRSNIKFRICLRVETAGESREMLRRSDAAFLPGDIPGRGYLQVGNEEIELVQVAYTGDRYVDPTQLSEAPVLWPDRDETYDESQDREPPELYRAIVDNLNELSRTHRIEKQRAPWPDFLPEQLSLSQLLVSQDFESNAITSEEYLADVDTIMLGQERDVNLTLNPAVNKWINGENGWLERLDWKNYAMRPVVGLIDNPYAAKQLPLTVNLPRGHVAIFGASGWGKTTFIRSLIISLAATHSPDHLHIYLLDLGGRNLSILEKLPQVGSVIIPDAEGYEERVEQLLRMLDEMIEERKNILNNARVPDLYDYNALPKSEAPETLPAILVAIDNFVEFKETFGGEKDGGVETVLDKFVLLARQAKSYGIHFIISANQLNALSSQLYSLFTERLTLKLTDTSDYRAIVGGQVADIGNIPGRGYIKIGPQPLSFQIALPVDSQYEDQEDQNKQANETKELEQLATYMDEFLKDAPHQYKKPLPVEALPKAVLFKQRILAQDEIKKPINAQFLDHLRAHTDEKWRASLRPREADWLRVKLGVISGNRLREMHLEAKEDGVHGLIAGGTGSGKSELLMTLIVGLALNYDPAVLNFVLVDYKGGGAFQPFEELPHCVDLITNLNKSAVRRVFTAIDAEIKRRQKLNTETGTKDIVAYRQEGLHLTYKPYPHLFIIIDEYAEMISESPEFKNELESITRVGRAQGVNLLLAAQRPIGVTDQMRANIKFRICLRVEEINTSREMLRRSDAAFLPSGMPGRGYLQVGNENIELMQVSYTGEEYAFAEMGEGGKKPKFYDIAVALTQELLQKRGARSPHTPWPPFLPNRFTLSHFPGILNQKFQEYLHADYESLVTLDQGQYQNSLACLNPFVKEWLDGKIVWSGMDWDETAMRAVIGLVDNPYEACLLPLVINVTQGHVILFGASGWGKSTFMRSLVVSLAATHSPDEFQAHLLGGRNLEVLQNLPHVGTVIMPDDQGYEERVQQLLRELNELVDERKQLFNRSGAQTLYEYNGSVEPDQVKPAILIIIDNFAEFIETFGEGSKKDKEDNLLDAFVMLIRQAKSYGLHFVVSANRLNELSNKLYSLFTERLTLRLSDSGDYHAIVGANISEIEPIAGRGYVKVGRQPLEFQVAIAGGEFDEKGQLRLEMKQIRELGQQMETLGKGMWSGQEPFQIGALPTTSLYRQVLSEVLDIDQERVRSFVGALKSKTRKQWHLTSLADNADWLKVTLGISSGNRKRELYLSAKDDGVHGLIAGGTGSGKSELLMTMIIGLAINHSPDIVNFVLVDYKGGGAFLPFERLPHCVDIVTNLNKAAVHRMFISINAEMRRRQKLNAETGTKDIVDYRRKNLHKTHAPYPHLFIIIDEYAEMIDDNPEYRAELESITRVGRAQGVNLILASQRPKGVTDQMRANIKLRLCLRVEQVETSRELLRRPDAALLPSGYPGRGYLQVGNDNPELMQISFTGDNQPDDREVSISWPDRPQVEETQASEDVPKLFDAVVMLTSELVDGQMAPKPWPGFLPSMFSLQSQLYDAQNNQTFTLTTAVTDWLNSDTENLWPGVDWNQEAMRPVVGLADNPAEASQYPLSFNLSRNHLALFGDSGMGKSTLLRTLVVSLAATHSPSEFHAYILDLGGRNFRSLEELPHVGAIIYADEEAFEERLQRLVDKLTKLTEDRQQILSQANAKNLYEYNRHHPEHALPAVMVVIDNFAELKENYEQLVESTITPLVRRSLNAGLSFVVSANVPNNLPSRFYNLFGERITFKQTNTDLYLDIVGRGAIDIDDISGRGYIRVGRRPLLFHIALPVGVFDQNGQDSLNEAKEIQRMAINMKLKSGKRNLPEPIRTLPQLITLRQVLPKHIHQPKKKQRIMSVLGQNDKLKKATFELKRMGPHFAVTGPPLSGKTTALYNWVLSLAHQYSPQQVKLVLVDFQARFVDYGGETQLSNLPHVASVISEAEEIPPLVKHLEEECEILDEGADYEIFIIIDNFDDFADELSSVRDNEVRDATKEMTRIARRYGTRGIHFVAAGSFSVASDIGRIILSSSYGIGLQSVDSLNVLRVTKIPGNLRGKELNIGRGFIARSGQLSMIQLATPYQDDLEVYDFDEDPSLIGKSLDKWISEIKDKYPQQKATWSGKTVKKEEAAESSQQNEQLMRIMSLLQRFMRWEMKELDGSNGVEDSITHKLLQLDVENWGDEKAIKPVLKEIWAKLHHTPMNIMEDVGVDDKDILMGIENRLGDE